LLLALLLLILALAILDARGLQPSLALLRPDVGLPLLLLLLTLPSLGLLLLPLLDRAALRARLSLPILGGTLGLALLQGLAAGRPLLDGNPRHLGVEDLDLVAAHAGLPRLAHRGGLHGPQTFHAAA
jgi:hypothetical protein